MQETHAWLAFAMCTAAGHKPYKARQQWVEPEPWDAVQSVVRTEVRGSWTFQILSMLILVWTSSENRHVRQIVCESWAEVTGRRDIFGYSIPYHLQCTIVPIRQCAGSGRWRPFPFDNR